ncbi:MAG TPA: hypothetical protein VGP82_17290 [Ktedonobacterales bacterium]|jgi:hypothetical protein|nr:hypothetical protein [Ktedonobacterales bacterium]
MSRGRNRRGDNPSLLARAETQTAAGADALFNRLDALSSQREQAAALFTRWAERLVAGAWDPDIAELVTHAEALERTLASREAKR